MNKFTFKDFVNLMSYIAVVLIAVMLLIQLILSLFDVSITGSAIEVIGVIGECIAYLVTAVCAFSFVRRKQSPIWAIIYTIAVTAIIILLVFVKIRV